MRLIKRQSKQTYVSKQNGKEYHYYNYFLELENGKRVQVRVSFARDIAILDAVAVYER